MLRPYTPPAPTDSPRQSVVRVLRDQRIGVDLRLRNRHQDEFVGSGAVPLLELPAGGVLAVPDQILAPFSFTVELKQALVQDHGARDGPCERPGDRDRAGP